MSTPAAGISVVLPFYRHGRELDDAIQSIVAQTHREWELLLVANNPNPEALEIATRRVQQDGRITLLHEARQGIAHALNLGLRRAAFPYIARMDADDSSAPERLERQLAFMQQHPEIGVVACRTRFEPAAEEAEGFARFVAWQNAVLSPEQHALYRFVESPVAHPSVLFRKNLVEQWGGYDTGSVPEDYELWLRWMDKGVAFQKLPEVLLSWRDGPQRLSRTHPHYSQEAFWGVKSRYLASWLRRHVSPDRKIVVCGASSTVRLRGALLEKEGISLYGYTDVKNRILRHDRFVPLVSITAPGRWFLINAISKRGVGEAVAAHFIGMGFREGVDFLRAG
jgi:glycosyltransferase involved in cell wall biosynthesis